MIYDINPSVRAGHVAQWWRTGFDPYYGERGNPEKQVGIFQMGQVYGGSVP